MTMTRKDKDKDNDKDEMTKRPNHMGPEGLFFATKISKESALGDPSGWLCYF